jgi:RNA polymerase sigma-70 factor (ECF subfamily)
MDVTEKFAPAAIAVDDGLVARAKTGDADAFEALVGHHFERTLRVARAITGNDADARDATQDAFLAVWRGLPRLRDEARFEPWLNQVLLNRCRDLLRRRRRVREITIEEVEVAAPEPDLGGLGRAAILRAFDRLSITDRQILVLHHLEGYPVAEIGRRLDIPIGTAKSRLYAARRSLGRALEREG